MRTSRLVLAACTLLLPWLAARAQDLPPATTSPDQPVAVPATPAPAPAPAPPRTHHVRHRRHRVVHPQAQAATPLEAPPPLPAGSPGTAPAPMPNEDIGPPRAPATADASVNPGNLSIHYPPLGQGYLPGSSPQDMANTQTPKVPGLTVKVPLAQGRPETLPPPQAH